MVARQQGRKNAADLHSHTPGLLRAWAGCRTPASLPTTLPDLSEGAIGMGTHDDGSPWDQQFDVMASMCSMLRPLQSPATITWGSGYPEPPLNLDS